MALINDFLSLIYPRACPACGEILYGHEKGLCRLCLLSLPRSNFHLQDNNALSLLLGGRVPLEKTLCLFLFEKSGKVQKLVHAIKYKGQKELARYLGMLLGKEYLKASLPAQFDYILPVPLHPKREKARGYNQSRELAKALSEVLGVPVQDGIVYRIKESSSQTRKRKFERWENVEGLFAKNPTTDLKHKHLLLVDDVVTTGATIEALWQCLKEEEGIRVSLACLGFAKMQDG